MTRLRHLPATALLLLALPHDTAAQSSANYDASEQVLNAGGAPAGGQELVSPQYRLSLASLGDPLAVGLLSSAQYSIAGTLVASNRPPGEVLHLRWNSSTELAWDPEAASARYNLYRAALTALPGGYGTCLQPALGSPVANETAVPPAGQGWFYLVAAETPLGEEGTLGNASNGSPRNTSGACP
jgi:hypothetical protein